MLSVLLALLLAAPGKAAKGELTEWPSEGADCERPAVTPLPGAMPEDFHLPYQRLDGRRMAAERRAAWVQLLRYSCVAEEVLVGQIVTSRGEADGVRTITLRVHRALRGTPDEIVNFTIQPRRRVEDPTATRPTIVHGYEVLVFLDARRALLEGNALFLVEGGHAWRNKREGVFLRPTADRVWEDVIDPEALYTAFSLEEIEASLDTRKARRRLRERR